MTIGINMNIQNYKKTNGFTLIEALVAISLLMTAMASAISVTQKSLSSSVLSRDQMTASFLAQDGLEAVKNIRDHIAISTSGSWLAGLENCECSSGHCDFDQPSSVQYCAIDTTVEPLVASSRLTPGIDTINPLKAENISNTTTFLKYDYNTNAGLNSKFSRLINIKIDPAYPYEAEVNVRVSWTSPLGPQNVDVNDFIYNYSPWTN
jgi:type II secretory pathway pseudopilin PulG